ncbi:kelch repeat-containing protein [Paraburkholderia diazotrophica]|uniref:kelch repeat-containing protein n=1 Tax=Paraburkholderia diazotrophica TaxID=667676 RepID=UPI00317637FE
MWIGGYGAGQVARAYHHVFDASRGQWEDVAPIPRGANHVGVAEQDGVIYAFGGFVEQDRIAVPDCYAYVVSDDRWHVIRPLSRGSRGAVSVVAANGLIHPIGGRDTRSVDWHEALARFPEQFAKRRDQFEIDCFRITGALKQAGNAL